MGARQGPLRPPDTLLSAQKSSGMWSNLLAKCEAIYPLFVRARGNEVRQRNGVGDIRYTDQGKSRGLEKTIGMTNGISC